MNPSAYTQLIAADDRLSAVFRHIYAIRQPEKARPEQKQLLPNYERMLVFNFGPPVAFSLGEQRFDVQRTRVIGPLQTLLRYTLPPGADVLVVVFALNGFHRLLGKALPNRKEGAVADPDSFGEDNRFHDLWEPLMGMKTVGERVAFINEYALLTLAPPDDDTRSMLDGVAIFANPALDPVRAVAGARKLSPRTVQVRFQTHLGFSAKDLARFLRFKRVVTYLMEHPPTPPDWADVVYTHGYHDQSHFIKDFQQFVGMTPTEFMKQLADDRLCLSQPGKHY